MGSDIFISREELLGNRKFFQTKFLFLTKIVKLFKNESLFGQEIGRNLNILED
jgi:hypothetical protein